ncbi:hypothetical protein [Leptolyngbya sp. FACHB-711]|uniref:hypothetical protein n=1 Tax=unclassified Leptolyngbya TaxID=2650499 RepID=UPI001686BCA5|nr:hypothetical protein [Leptolyngbya sp. FACHB-711]MBD1851162.1 hypothetical protein [Cyanobacteria bacterium FACHB-502]MBD2027214.1 hypothetical protein [Leptolyngbya sp. FACHB-711]
MTNALFSLPNGSAHSNHSWMQQSVQQFFSHFNWDNQPPELHKFQISSGSDDDPAASLMLTVSQFFSTINWEGSLLHLQGEPHCTTTLEDSLFPASVESFTLDDFSDLF